VRGLGQDDGDCQGDAGELEYFVCRFLYYQEDSMKTRWFSKILAGVATSLILLSLLGNSARAAAGDTTRGSVASDGAERNYDSQNLSIFDNRLYAAFDSGVSKLQKSASQMNNPNPPFSTFFGGSANDNDYVGDMTLDAQGNIILVGATYSSDFPSTSGAFDTSFNGSTAMADAFVAKFDPSGKLLYSTFLGGSQNDWANKVVVDPAGNIYVVGRTESSDYPKTADSFNQTLNGGSDIFITMLNSSGTQLLHSILFGGSSWDEGVGITLDDQGNIYLTGYTYSSDFHTSSGAYVQYCASYHYMPFVLKFQSDFKLAFSTCLGGDEYTTGKDIFVDSSGNPIIIGRYAGYGYADIFVIKINSKGSELIFSNIFGGNDWDEPFGAVIDSKGNIFITGETLSSTFPVTLNAFDRTYNGSYDAFVTKINPSGFILYSTFLGGTDSHTGLGNCYDIGYDITVSTDGKTYITGVTDCPFFPTTQNAFQSAYLGNRDAFVSVLNPDESNLIYSSFLGGSGNTDLGKAIELTSYGAPIILGNTYSNDFPITINSFDPTFNGQSDIFLTALTFPNIELPYTISGFIKDDLGNPKAGVLVTLNDGQITTTDGAGFYQFYISEKISYTITPRLINFRFAPEQATIDLAKKTTQDFIVRPDKPARFLDLPIAYPFIPWMTDQEEFALAIQGSIKGKTPGYVNSWFDHTTPRYGRADGNLTIWNGISMTGTSNNISVSNCELGRTCYDYHNGIDFSSYTMNADQTIYAAAAGTVVAPDKIVGYGNEVLIDHHNGYATFYGHLSRKDVIPGDNVSSRQAIGVMGNTGQKGMGIHLHFGLYYDKNGDHDWEESEVVDPFGWNPVYDPGKIDPWNVKSSYLWLYSNSLQCMLTSSGTTLKSPTGMLTVQIPAGAVSTDVTLEILDTPPVADASANLRFTGQSFLTRILEWLSGSSAIDSKGVRRAAETNFAQPVNMIVNYDPAQLIHLDLTNLALYLWNDLTNTWVALSSTIDSVNHTVTAQTTSVGNFSLQAPLICPADHLEPNDNYDGASLVQTNGKQAYRLFDIAQDEDWFKFDALAGVQYSTQTTNLAAGVDTALEIYDTDGVTLLATDDNSGGGKASLLTWQAPADGTYYVRVKQAAGSTYGCESGYNLDILATYYIYLPLAGR
jgi:murein DD-endopeptidase MepM/ murein hydrolase activator NlpD